MTMSYKYTILMILDNANTIRADDNNLQQRIYISLEYVQEKRSNGSVTNFTEIILQVQFGRLIKLTLR